MPLPLVSNFFYNLPKKSIANSPVFPRDHSRLLTLNRQTGEMVNKHFYDLADLLMPDDVLVLNQTKVFPARLFGVKPTGGKCEVLLLRQLTSDTYEIIGTNLKPNLVITFSKNLTGQIISHNTIHFSLSSLELLQEFNQIGHTPLPPYIHNSDSELVLREKYQTVFATTGSSAAAPTAGLHFTAELLEKLKQKKIQIEFVNLNVGLGTFQNLRPENLTTKTLHEEYFELQPDVAMRLNLAKARGKRVVAVGTTTTRVLESSFQNKQLIPQKNTTNIFIFPEYKFNFIDSLITNFHLPESSLLMLVSAFTSYPNTPHKFDNFLSSKIGKSYLHAISSDYRFFSFGDAMWIY